MSLVVQGLFIAVVLQQTRAQALRLEKKIHEMSLWFSDSILFRA
jgi:hypothetical protein